MVDETISDRQKSYARIYSTILKIRTLWAKMEATRVAFPINKPLKIRLKPIGPQRIDEIILKKVESLLGRPIDWVNYKLIKEDKRTLINTYHIIEACNYRDKDRKERWNHAKTNTTPKRCNNFAK